MDCTAQYKSITVYFQFLKIIVTLQVKISDESKFEIFIPTPFKWDSD